MNSFQLWEKGFTKTRLDGDFWNDFHLIRSEFKEFLSTDVTERQDVLGGFGTFGNPSSFHHPKLRQYRRRIKEMVADVLREIPDYEGKNLECMYDVMCLQSIKFGSALSTPPHRDLRKIHVDPQRAFKHRPNPETDVFFRAWINCNEMGGGPDRWQRIRFYYRSQLVELDSVQKPVEIVVYPNEMVLYDQRLVRELVPVTCVYPSARMFFTFRVTHETEPIYDTYTIAKEQTVPYLYSGAQAPVMSFLHMLRADSREKIVEFTNTLKPQYRCPPITGNSFDMPCIGLHFSMLGLTKEDRYSEYTDDEISCMHPEPLVIVSER